MRPFANMLRTGRSPEGLWRRASIGNGYGSECNLLRYLGRHRSRLDAAIMKTIPDASAVRWVDFHFDPTCNWKDAERTALDFLDADHPARVAWTWAWPHRGASRTAYRPTRHPRRTPVEEAVQLDILEECARRGLPRSAVEVLSVETGPRGGLTAHARLTFRRAVSGPLLLGRGSHFGAGLFSAE